MEAEIPWVPKLSGRAGRREQLSRRPAGVVVREHEGALAASFTITSTAPPELLDAGLSEGLLAVSRWVREQQGLVGHIKASLQEPGETCMYSITEEELMKKSGQSRECQIHVAVIVFLVDKTELKKQLEDFLTALAKLSKGR